MAAAARKKPEDFEGRYFDMVEASMEGMDKKIDRLDGTVTSLTKKVGKLENEVFPNQPQNAKDLPKWYRDPAVIKLLTLVAGAIILITSLAAALLGKSLPGIF